MQGSAFFHFIPWYTRIFILLNIARFALPYFYFFKKSCKKGSSFECTHQLRFFYMLGLLFSSFPSFLSFLLLRQYFLPIFETTVVSSLQQTGKTRPKIEKPRALTQKNLLFLGKSFRYETCYGVHGLCSFLLSAFCWRKCLEELSYHKCFHFCVCG